MITVIHDLTPTEIAPILAASSQAVSYTQLTGSYRGLLARGNFEVSADWAEGQATKFEILSKSGESCKVKYDNLASAKLTDSQGNDVLFTTEGKDIVCFDTKEGETYTFKMCIRDSPTPPYGGNYFFHPDFPHFKKVFIHPAPRSGS